MINNLTAADVQQLVHYFNDLLNPNITYVRKDEIINEVRERYKIKKRKQYEEIIIAGNALDRIRSAYAGLQKRQS